MKMPMVTHWQEDARCLHIGKQLPDLWLTVGKILPELHVDRAILDGYKTEEQLTDGPILASNGQMVK